jgi:hypothetical protein
VIANHPLRLSADAHSYSAGGVAVANRNNLGALTPSVCECAQLLLFCDGGVAVANSNNLRALNVAVNLEETQIWS